MHICLKTSVFLPNRLFDKIEPKNHSNNHMIFFVFPVYKWRLIYPTTTTGVPPSDAYYIIRSALKKGKINSKKYIYYF